MKNYRYYLKINELAAGIVTALSLIGNAAAVNTHIQTDGTLSGIADLNINAPGSGLPYTLSEINGKLSGHNLFYSFSNFSIGTADSALFNLNTLDLAHVISRVTGGSESLIDGKLQMTNVGSTPSFFFINPAGITFGSGASVDVPGSFYVSTASGLNFSDGSQLAINETSTSALSSANPESFGFLGDETGNINIGSLETSATELTFRPGAEIAFVGNQIYIDNATVKNEDFSQAGLDLQLVATGNETTNVKLSALPEQATDGDLITTSALLNVSGNGSGRVMVRSGNFSASNSDFVVVNTGDIPMENDQGISVYANTIDLRQTDMHTFAIAKGSGGNVNVLANSIQLIDGGAISTLTIDQGNSGSIAINAGQIEINNGEIRSDTYGDDGSAGDVIITANSLNLENNGAIRSLTTSTTLQGASGDILIHTKSLGMNKSNITNGTEGKGHTGNIAITTDSLLVNNSSGIVLNTLADGNVGTLMIDSKLIVIDKGFFASKTIGDGNAGDINITTDLLKMSYSGEIDPDFTNGIDAGTFSDGDGGNVIVNADQIEMTHGFIGTSTGGEGTAGFVFLKANSLVLTDAAIVSNTLSQDEGVGGQVFIEANNLKMIDSDITSDAASGGNAGSVSVLANSMLMDNSRVSSSTIDRGSAGKISINADELTITNNSIIQSETFGVGKAGSISISSSSLYLDNRGVISSSSRELAEGDGGEITINTGFLEINNGAILNVALDSIGDAGIIVIQSDTLKLDNKGLISTATLENAIGNGGIVNIHANRLEINDSNIVNTTFGAGKAGHVFISGNSISLNGGSIESAAREGSSGQTGNIEIDVETDIQLSDAKITISNDATVTEDKLSSLTPTAINIDTANLFLTNSRIAADSNGNVDAGSIHIHFADQLFLDPSQISTEAASGNGGAITVQGNGAVFLLDSAITTSVSGQSGNGGDIAIAANGLILDSGFIQANTAASGASGGNVDIKTPALIPSGNSLFVGGNTPFQFQPFSGLNVIQAAAPDGVGGTINTSTPQLNLNAMLTNLVVESFDSNVLNRDMCAVSESSSLMQSGKGAQPLRARDLLLSPLF